MYGRFPVIAHSSGKILKDSQGSLLDSIISFEFYQSDSLYLPVYRTIVGYDSIGRATMSTNYFSDSATGAWKEDFRNTEVFDNRGNIIHFGQDLWSDSTDDWFLSYIANMSYDTQNRDSHEIDSTRNSSAGKWFPAWMVSSVCNGITITQKVYYWDRQAIQWKLSYREDVTNDSEGNPLQQIYSNWDAYTSQYYAANRVDMTYDKNGNITQLISCNWDTGENKWDSIYMDADSYSLDGVTETDYYLTWDQPHSRWDTISGQLYIIESIANTKELLLSTWDTVSRTWVEDSKSIYYYMSVGNHKYEILNRLIINLFTPIPRRVN